MKPDIEKPHESLGTIAWMLVVPVTIRGPDGPSLEGPSLWKLDLKLFFASFLQTPAMTTLRAAWWRTTWLGP